nr:RNA-directed DNA polymerase, eukaryota, reverse transcriptase zinc-binding domain protein [Tanacetum cinerariifolium]
MVRNTSTIQDTNGWCWKFRNNKQDSSISIRNQFHKEVEKIASSFYITNFHDYVDAKRLWVECQSYGRIVDAFIANKRSKAGKRFGFVCFLGVKNEEQLARSLASIWIGSYHLLASVACFNRQEKNEVFSKNNREKITNFIPSQKADHVGSSQNKKSYASSLNGDRDRKVKKQVTAVIGNTLSNVPLTPSLITTSLVLDDSCVSVRDLSQHVMGRVKDLNSISNLRTLLTKEGFSEVKLTYLGGMWVMIELDNEATKLKLLQHIGVNSWFHVLQAAIHDFVSDERVVWVDIEGVPLNVWSRETFLKIGKKWGETMEENLQLYDINQMEARDYVQKSKIKWAIVGDENSKFFHGIINKKRSQLSIRGVFVDGDWNTDPGVVKDVFKDHFATRFKKPAHGRLKLNILFPNRLSTDRVADMDRSVSEMKFVLQFRIMARISLLVQTGIRLNSLGDIGGSLALISVRLLNVSLKMGLFRREKQAMIFKVDFAKAYDSVRWDYLLDVLQAFGFGPNWCKWIRGTFSPTMASILVNGSPTLWPQPPSLFPPPILFPPVHPIPPVYPHYGSPPPPPIVTKPPPTPPVVTKPPPTPPVVTKPPPTPP